MDLALELGMTYEQLRNTMSDSELRMWSRRRNEQLFPMQRLELYLAQLTRWVAIVSGQHDAKTEDFMLKFAAPGNPAPAGEVDVEALQDAFNFAPRVVRRKNG